MKNQAFADNTVVMSTDNYNSLLKHTFSFPETETAAILIGPPIQKKNIVEYVVIPKENCKRTPTSVTIDKDFAIATSKEYANMGRSYLGTFHTHLGYGGPSFGDDEEARKHLEINPHKSKVISIIVDVKNPFSFDIYVVLYERKDNKIYKKQLSLVLIPSKKLKRIVSRYLSTINYVKNIAQTVDEILRIETTIQERSITNEYLIQIPIDTNNHLKIVKEIEGSTINTKHEGTRLFIYISIPRYTSFLSDSKEKILVGISSKDYSSDILICKFHFKHLFNPTLLADVIQRIFQNISTCIKMNISKFLLREITVN